MSADKKAEVKNSAKACFDDGFAEINGRKYVFGSVNHKTRLKIFGYFQSIGYEMSRGSMAFMGTDEFSKIEDIMFSNITFEDSALIKIKDSHFDKCGEDFPLLVPVAMGVFCYPFMRGTS